MRRQSEDLRRSRHRRERRRADQSAGRRRRREQAKTFGADVQDIGGEHPHDRARPGEEDHAEVEHEFERTAWAGLEPDRYAWAAVLHRERGGGAHVHVLAARCDLETGRSLNIAPPGWEKTFGPLRDAVNAEHGLGRPDDPARARVQQPGHRAYIEAARLRAGLGLESSPPT